MKRIVVTVAAVLALSAVFAGPAAARHTLSHRVSVLETKVSNLQTRVNRLYNFTHNCLAWDWVSLASYGDPNGTYGYVWEETGPDGTTVMSRFRTTGLDFAPTDQALFFTSAVNPNCLTQVRNTSSALRSQMRALTDAGGARQG